MRRVRVRALVAVAVVLTASAVTSATADVGSGRSRPSASSPGEEQCIGTFDTWTHHAVRRLRFGVDPGIAGNPLPGPAPAPVDRGRETAALRDLRPAHRDLVVRLNRLFWSGGDQLLREFARQARGLGRKGFDVEVQVRYHPRPGDEGRMTAWRHWVRHVVDVLAANRHVVSLTVTNEVNLSISSNTSDGSFDRAEEALVDGILAAHDELRRHGWASRVALGFTFAYRFNPGADAKFWRELDDLGGSRFRAALGFVGLDDYPGTFYPPVLAPGSPTGGSPGEALAEAVATMRRCYLPMAGITAATPLWVTENGYPTRAGRVGEAAQLRALEDMVTTTRSIGATYGVTDYRWFNLRDNVSSGTGLFDTDGLLRDDYSRKPSYRALRQLVGRYGTRG